VSGYEISVEGFAMCYCVMNEFNSRLRYCLVLAMFYDYFDVGYSEASVAIERGWKKGVVGDWGFLFRSNLLKTLLLALV